MLFVQWLVGIVWMGEALMLAKWGQLAWKRLRDPARTSFFRDVYLQVRLGLTATSLGLTLGLTYREMTFIGLDEQALFLASLVFLAIGVTLLLAVTRIRESGWAWRVFRVGLAVLTAVQLARLLVE